MTTHKPVNVLLVGQIYFDTILDVDHFPEEDHKLRAKDMEQRLGGNTTNTGIVLAQFPCFKVWCMSAIGPKEASGQLITQLEERGIKTEYCIHRSKAPTPSSFIIQSRATGSRTIISRSTIQDLTLDDFKRKIDTSDIAKTMSFNFEKNVPFNWIHFEGRNIDNAVQQIEWIDTKATKEGWRSKVRISVELEKPDRENIDSLMPKGDIVFFSKLFAERRGYKDPKEFLYSVRNRCKPSATLFCTWGADGAVCLPPAGQPLHSPALKVPVVDPVGAGDTFIAGIIYSISRGMPLNSSLEFACHLASRKVGRSGYDGLANAGALQSSSSQPRTFTSSTSPLISHSSK